MRRFSLFAAVAIGLASPTAAQTALPADPLQSPMWEFVAEQMFGEGAVVRFDNRLKVTFPGIAENQRTFPVAVDGRGIEGIQRIILFADLNPIQQAIDYRLAAAEPYLATRIKLDQRTPVRGAAQLVDGSWIVSGGWIDAAGGGCSAPPVSRVKGDWSQHLGEVRGRAWAGAGDTRLRLTFRHPMDTGLVDNIATYHIDELIFSTAAGKAVGTMTMMASVSEDPVITVMPRAGAGETLVLAGRDTNGITYDARVPIGAAISAAGAAR